MTKHRTRTSRLSRLTSARTRALLSLTAVAALASGMGIQGTFAFWTDAATMQTGSFTTGTLDITLNGNLVGPGTANNPGTWTNASFPLDQLIPNESAASTVTVKNNGTVGLTYTLSGSVSTPLAGTLTVSVYLGGTATPGGSQAAGTRSGSCNGGTPLVTNQTLTAASASIVATARPLAAGVTENICFVIGLPPTAGNTVQNQTGAVSILFDSKQVGS